MSSVDERVVELSFDNKQFEEGVKTSLGTLEKLKQGLKLEKAGQALDNLKVTGKKFDMSGVSSAVEAVTNKFSVLGTIGDQVLRRLTDSALRFGKNLMTAIPNQIISGGKRRAQNIEQAQFQLKGLMGDEFDWDVISKDLDYAVAGTAYGLDAAAKVASQLKASNIDFGEDMQQALRGISGVAAMTNSEYEEIGHIFTTIAGQGKLMTDQLNQFAGRGLNVAAELAKAYNVDEATLREMVTKGQVDFKTFAKAMNEAFGEHATKANETFTGALSNVKASLSRMGANFATPIYDNLKKIFNALLPLMKNVEKLVKPVAAAFSALLDSAVTPLIGFMEKLKVSFDDFLVSIGLAPVQQLAEDIKNVAHSAEELEEMVKKVINGDFGNGADRKKALEELGWSYAKVQNRVNEVLGCSKRYDEALEDETDSSKKAGKAAKEAADAQGKNAKATGKAAKEARSSIDMLKDTVLGIVSAVNILKSAGTAVLDHIIKPFAKFAIPKILGAILTVTSSIGRYLTALDITLTKNDTFNKFFGTVEKYAGIAYKAVQSFAKQARDSFDRLKNMPGVMALQQSLLKLKKALDDLKNSVIGAISKKIKELTDAFKSSGFDMSGFFTVFENVVNTLAWALSGLIENLIKGGTAIGNFLGKFKGPAISLVKRLYETLKGLFKTVSGAASSAFKMVSDAVGDIFDAISNVDVLGVISGALENIQKFGTAIVDNVIRPFINYGLPSVLEKISGLLSGIGDILGGIIDRIASSNAFTKVVTVIGGAIQSAANAIVGFGNKVRDTFVQIKNSEGVQHLVESLSGLKDVVVEIAQAKFGQFVEFLSGIGGAVGEITGKLPDINIFDTIASVLSTIAEAAAGFIDAVIGKGATIAEFIAPFKDAAVDKIIAVAGAITKLAKAVGSEGFALLGSAGKSLGEFFKSLNKSEGFGKLSEVSTSVNGVFDKTLGDPTSLKERAFKAIKSIVDGIVEGFKSLDFEKLLANAKTVAVIGLIIELIALTKKVREVTVGFGKTLDTIKKLPTKVIGVFDKFTETMTLYQKSIKADILLKIAYAVAIMTLSLIALTNVDIPSLNAVAVDIGGVMLAMAALMWAYSKIMDNTAKVKESEAKLAEANKKEDPNPALVGIKDFLKKLGDAAGEAMKTVAQSISFVLLAVAVTILMGVVERIVKLDMSLHQAMNVGIELIVLFGLILAATFILSKIKDKMSANEGFAILELAAAVYVLVEAAKKISEIPDDQVLKAVGVIASFVLMFGALMVASEHAKFEGLAGSVIAITAAIILMLIPLKVISEMDADKLAKALEVIALLMIGMGALALALGSAGEGAIGGGIAMLAIAASILILVPALTLLGAVAPVATNGLKLLAGALAILVVAGVIAGLPLVSVGLIALTAAIVGLGIGMLAAGVGISLFGSGLLTLTTALLAVGGTAAIGASALGTALGLMIAALLDAGSKIVEAAVNLVLELIDAFRTVIPQLALVGVEVVVAIMAGILSQIQNIVVIGVAIVVALANGIISMMDVIVDAAVKVVVAFVNGVANALRENSQPIILAFANLVNAVSRFIAQALYDLTKDLPVIGDFFKTTLEEMDADAEWIMNEQRGYEKTSNYMSGLKDGVTDNLPDFAKNLLGIKKESDAVFKEMSEEQDPYGKQFMHNRAKGMEEGATEVNKVAEQTSTDLLDQLSGLKGKTDAMDLDIGGTITKSLEKTDLKAPVDTLGSDLKNLIGGIDVSSEAGDLGVAVDEGTAGGILSMLNLPEDAVVDMDQLMIQAGRDGLDVNSPSKVFEEIGEGVPEGMEKGVKAKTNSVQTVVTDMATKMINAMKSKTINFRTVGSDMALNLVTGLKSMSDQASDAGESVAKSAASGANSAYSNAKSAGSYTAQGIIDGVNSKMGDLYNVGVKAGNKVNKGYKDTVKVKSPSRVMRQNGRYTGEGLILGIRDTFLGIYRAGEEAGDRVTQAIRSPLTRMLAVLNNEADMNPTIRPVLDISDVEKNAGKIQSLMPTSSVGLSFAAGGAVRGAMSFKTTNDDVVNAINALNTRLDNMPRGDVFNVGDVTYDDGTNVATAVRSLINAARIQRRA